MTDTATGIYWRFFAIADDTLWSPIVRDLAPAWQTRMVAQPCKRIPGCQRVPGPGCRCGFTVVPNPHGILRTLSDRYGLGMRDETIAVAVVQVRGAVEFTYPHRRRTHRGVAEWRAADVEVLRLHLRTPDDALAARLGVRYGVECSNGICFEDITAGFEDVAAEFSDSVPVLPESVGVSR